ncbi:hypothetical protein BC829DRAFT_17247 [Chytridium lagenaria]|nr:hypothetical protein BC829DRAFT_17247 [Chytridium lagenaria]
MTSPSQFDCNVVASAFPSLGIPVSNNRTLCCRENYIQCNFQAKITELYFSSSNLTGQLPIALRSLGELRRLFLSKNAFEGTIPTEWSELKSLQYLYLDQNNLTGNVPSSFSNLANLEWLYLFSNNLSGVFPDEIFSLPRISEIRLQNNYFYGKVPSVSARVADLRLDGNCFTAFELPSKNNATQRRFDQCTNFRSFSTEILQTTTTSPPTLPVQLLPIPAIAAIVTIASLIFVVIVVGTSFVIFRRQRLKRCLVKLRPKKRKNIGFRVNSLHQTLK